MKTMLAIAALGLVLIGLASAAPNKTASCCGCGGGSCCAPKAHSSSSH